MVSGFYNTVAWLRLRAYVLADEPMCRMHKAMGRMVPAEDVDHIIPINKGGPELDIENLQPLCHPCHSIKTAAERAGRSMRGWTPDGPLDPAHHWNAGEGRVES